MLTYKVMIFILLNMIHLYSLFILIFVMNAYLSFIAL